MDCNLVCIDYYLEVVLCGDVGVLPYFVIQIELWVYILIGCFMCSQTQMTL